MSLPEIVDLSSDDEAGEAQPNLMVKQEPGLVVKQEPGINVANIQHTLSNKPSWAQQQTSTLYSTWQDSPASRSSNAVQSNSTIPGQVVPARATNGSAFATKLPPAPLSRQFWKAGNYDDAQASRVQLQSGQNHLRVHPKFLHSNATSHKWAFGAIAELLDNAFDEVQNGASFVEVDKIINPKDGCPALLIHDDGGGMDPESIRRCMSFGFSAKKSKSSIGQYGNGFKTSTMRLGADVIVFSRHMSKRTLTQSVGLLSYTFLRQTGHDRIVVPMVDYEFEESTGKLKNLSSHSAENFSANLSMLLQWSPYGTEAELLKQFDNMGHHGTKVIIYNLWFSDDGDLEFDFDSDPKDILISGAPKIVNSNRQGKMIMQHHIANRYPYSLRVYSSILYLRVPKDFKIILRGQVVEHHNLADDLKFPEYILYKPQIGGLPEAVVVTTIGFLKDAPHVNINGFSVYHKNRLIMPFWRVVSQTNSRGRGVAGVLEANFIEPTHNKQDFEKTTVFQKLEARLKDMTLEYWDFHCGLIGYQQVKKSSTSGVPPKASNGVKPVTLTPSSNNNMKVSSTGRASQKSNETLLQSPLVMQKESVSNNQSNCRPEMTMKRKGQDHTEDGSLQKQARSVENATNSRRHHWEAQHVNDTDKQLEEIMRENKKLRAQCSTYEKKEEDLNYKAELLKIELLEAQHEYARLLSESKAFEAALKEEKL